jgi:hypothetical protein
VPIALAMNMPLVRKNENSAVEIKCVPAIEEPLDGGVGAQRRSSWLLVA